MVLNSSYDLRLVALSVALAMVAAYAALDLSGRVTAARGRIRVVWLAAGATAMGLGIWAMHYIGMLAFELPVPVFYDVPAVCLSLMAAILASAVALFTVSREKMGVWQEIAGSLAMGGGIAAMHYIGMMAMRLPATMEYEVVRVVLSVLLAVAVSFVALVLAFRARQERKVSLRKLASAVAMGSAIPLMHYTGMSAVKFHASDVRLDVRHAVHISWLGIGCITFTTFFVLGIAIATAFLDRLLAAQREALVSVRESESRFRALAEALPEIVWTARADGLIDYCNRRWYELTQLSLAESQGLRWTQAIHPDDLPRCQKDWEQALSRGASFAAEYRLKDAEKGYRWHLVRATPVTDSAGSIIKWFGTCTDIEEQKHNQQILEEQIKERTNELATANTRLQEEMWEKDAARKELDLQNERMLKELTERSQRATLLAKMGEHLQSCVSKDEVFSAVLGYAPRIFPATRGAILLLNSGRNLVELTGSWAGFDHVMKVFEPSFCWALRTGHPHLVPKGDRTAPCAHVDRSDHTYLCVPVVAQGQALGILHFEVTDQRLTLSDAELSFKTTFAGQIGLSLANIRLRDALRTQSIRDSLTGMYNRRYLEETLDREIRRAVRTEQVLGLLILDLDHFKIFNDTYGHDAGDAVLRETASCLTKGVRAEDVVCRFGGEEFVILLPTADLEASHARAELLRASVRELNVVHQGKPLGQITMSIGVAALPANGVSARELLEAADTALYRAKNEGRDRVVCANPIEAADVAPSALEVVAAK